MLLCLSSLEQLGSVDRDGCGNIDDDAEAITG